MTADRAQRAAGAAEVPLGDLHAGKRDLHADVLDLVLLLGELNGLLHVFLGGIEFLALVEQRGTERLPGDIEFRRGLDGVARELLGLVGTLETTKHLREVVLGGGERTFLVDGESQEGLGSQVVALLQAKRAHHVVRELVAAVLAQNLARMLLGALAVVHRDVEVEDHVPHDRDVRTRGAGRDKGITRLLLERLALAHEHKRARHLHKVVARRIGDGLHLRQDDAVEFLQDLLALRFVLGRVELLEQNAREKRPGLQRFGLEVRHLLERESCRAEVVVHQVQKRPVETGALLALRSLHRLGKMPFGLIQRALLQCKTCQAHQRVMIGGVGLEHLVVDLARLLRLVAARVDGGHHVQEARLAVGRHEVDRALNLRDGVSGLAGTRPCVAHTGEDLRRADIAVVAGEGPEQIAAFGIVDDRLELALNLGLVRNRRRDPGARHLELVEERADVVAVNGLEDEFVELPRLLVLAEVLHHHAKVVRDEANMAAQLQTQRVDGILRVGDLARTLPLLGVKDRLHLRPERLEVSHGLVAIHVLLHVLHATEEQALRHGLALGHVPEVRHAEDRGLLGDLLVAHKPVLQERQHAQLNGEREVCMARGKLLLLHERGELLQVGIIHVALEADEVQLLATRRRDNAEMVVQHAVRHHPGTGPHAVDDLIGTDIRIGAAVARAAERVHQRRQGDDAEENAQHGRRHPAADHEHRPRLVVLNGWQWRPGQHIPIRREIATRHRDQHGRRHGGDSKGTHQALGRERRRERQNRADRHRDVEEVLTPGALVVESARSREHARDKRHDREDDDEEPPWADNPLAHLVRILLNHLHEDRADIRELSSRRFGQLQIRVRHAAGENQIEDSPKEQEESHRQIEPPTGLHRGDDDAQQEHRHQRDEDHALDESRGHANPQQRRKKRQQTGPAQHRHEQEEEQQRAANIEHAEFKMRRRLPDRR